MSDDQALFDEGLPIRREVLGADHVDASLAKADSLMMSFQRAATTIAWSWAWGDDALDRRTRGLMNLATLTALGERWRDQAPRQGRADQRLHRGRDQGGAAPRHRYCGIPAGPNAFEAAHEALPKQGALPADAKP